MRDVLQPRSWALPAMIVLGGLTGCGPGAGDTGRSSESAEGQGGPAPQPRAIAEAPVGSKGAAARRPCQPASSGWSFWPRAADRPFARQFNAAPSVKPTRINGLALDPAQNMLLAGQLAGAVDFGGGALTPLGEPDAFVVKLDPCGAHLWSKRFGDTASQAAIDIGADRAGNTIVMGSFDGTIDLGTGPLTHRGSPRDVFVAKLDPGGVTLWVKHVIAEEGGMYPTAMAVDHEGNTLILGSLEGTVSFGDSTVMSSTVTSFAAKIDPAGKTLWSARLGTSTDQEPIDIEVDRSGKAFVAGHDARGHGVFALALDAAGVVLWRKSFRVPPQDDEILFDLDVSLGGSALIAGLGFLGTDVDPSADPPHFAAALGAAGEPSWIVRPDAPPTRIAASTSGTLLLAGKHCQAAQCALILTRLDASGSERGEQRFDGNATVAALESDAQGRAVITGTFNGKLELPPRPLQSEDPALFVARLPR